MKLAIFGGTPAFSKPLRVVRPFLPHREDVCRIIDDLYESRFLTNRSRFVREFEEELQNYLEVKHVLLTSSGTIALQLLIKALGLRGEVIVPSFTFIATAHSLLWEGVLPIFADIERGTCTINPDLLDSYLTKNTQAIIAVNLFGNTCDIEKLESFCKKKNLKLIFDSAQALGCKYKGKPLGGFGEAEVFSFHATKIIHTLEGGMISTNNTDLYKKLRLMQDFGFAGSGKVVCLGTNAKMNEFSAAIGLKSLKSLEQIIEANKETHRLYNKLLQDIPGIEFCTSAKGNNYNTYQILIGEGFGLSRDMVCELLLRENVIVRKQFSPACHKQIPYKTKNNLPVTERVSERILSLPCFYGLTEKDIKKIVRIIKEAYNKRKKIKECYG